MGKRKKQTYTEELKRQVAEQVKAGGETGIIAAEHGISLGSVRNWAKQFGNGEVPKPTPPANGKAKAARSAGNGAVHAIRAEMKQHETAIAKLKKAEATLTQ